LKQVNALLNYALILLRFTESDDTRGCDNAIHHPEGEQSTARNMLRIIM